MLIRFKWSGILRGDGYAINIVTTFINELLVSTHYNLADVFTWLSYKGIVLENMFDELDSIDLFKFGREFPMPVYFLSGKFDLLTVPEAT